MTSLPSRSLWRNRDYQLLMTGRTLSVIGASMTALAVMLLAYDLTHNTATAAFITSWELVGMLVMSLLAGALVDRWDRKRVMVLSSLVQAVTIVSVPVALWAGHLTTWQLGIVCFVSGAASTFFSPAETASLKRIVGPDQLGTAMSVNQARGALGSVVGPPISGALYGISRALPMLVDAITCAVAACLAMFVRTDLKPHREEAQEVSSVWRDVIEGVRYIGSRSMLLVLGGYACLLNFGFSTVMTVVILDLQRRGTAPTLIGLIETVAGVAALVGAALAAPVLKAFPVGRLTIAVTAALFAELVALSLLPGYVWVLVLVGVMSLLLPPVNSGAMAFFTSEVHDAQMGRASGALGMVSMGMIPVGNVLGGFLLQHLGRWQGIAPGLVVVAVCVVLTFLPAIARIPRTSEFVPIEEREARAAGVGGSAPVA